MLRDAGIVWLEICRQEAPLDYYGKTMYFNIVFYYCLSRCYETLALSGLRFVDGKLPLTTMVRLNVFQHCVLLLFI